jgi:hypothetical protein
MFQKDLLSSDPFLSSTRPNPQKNVSLFHETFSSITTVNHVLLTEDIAEEVVKKYDEMDYGNFNQCVLSYHRNNQYFWPAFLYKYCTVRQSKP